MSVDVKRIASDSAIAVDRGSFVRVPRRVFRKSCTVHDSNTHELLFSLKKGVIKPDGLQLLPLSCLRNCNRMDAAGPANNVSGTSRIRTSDGRTRSRPVKSHTIGYNRNGLVSAWTRDHTAAASALLPIFTAMLDEYARVAPKEYALQKTRCKQRFLDLPFSSAALNCNLRTGLHKDRNDLPGTMGIMLVAGDDKVRGHELVFPEYGIAVDVRVGDVLVFDSRLWHANAKATNRAYDRRSLVMYAR
jgi:hypothetical protein